MTRCRSCTKGQISKEGKGWLSEASVDMKSDVMPIRMAETMSTQGTSVLVDYLLRDYGDLLEMDPQNRSPYIYDKELFLEGMLIMSKQPKFHRFPGDSRYNNSVYLEIPLLEKMEEEEVKVVEKSNLDMVLMIEITTWYIVMLLAYLKEMAEA